MHLHQKTHAASDTFGSCALISGRADEYTQRMNAESIKAILQALMRRGVKMNFKPIINVAYAVDVFRLPHMDNRQNTHFLRCR